MPSWTAVTELADVVLTAIREPALLDQRRVELHASVGIATSGPWTTADQLLRDADAAMSDAKRHDRGSFRVFDPELHAAAVRRLQLKMDLRSALGRDQMSVVYQPICSARTGQLQGFEARRR